MIVPVALIEIGPDELRLYGGWVEMQGMRMRYDLRLVAGDTLGDLDFAALVDLARAGRRLMLDESDGSLTLEGASAAAPGAALPPPSLES